MADASNPAQSNGLTISTGWADQTPWKPILDLKGGTVGGEDKGKGSQLLLGKLPNKLKV